MFLSHVELTWCVLVCHHARKNDKESFVVLFSILGLASIFGLFFMLSEDRSRVSLRQILIGLGFQCFITAIVFHASFMTSVFKFLQKGVEVLQESALVGARFVFGYLSGGDMPFDVKGNTFLFAFQAVMPIFVIGPLAMVLHYWGVLPFLVKRIGSFFTKISGVRGPLAVCAGAKMFFGQTDAPLFVRAYLEKMSRCDICAVIGMGMATTSVVVMPLYVSILQEAIPTVMMHLVTSTVISVPLALTLARILIPEDKGYSSQDAKVDGYKFNSTMEALSVGIGQAKEVIVGIVITLLVVVALTALVNRALGGVCPCLSLESIFGWLFSPIAWVMGFAWDQSRAVGNVLGLKVIFNEIVAFSALAKMSSLSMMDRIVLFYSLAGFANMGSLGIVVGAWRVFAPNMNKEIGSLALKGLLIGCMTALGNSLLIRLIIAVGHAVKTI